MSKVLKSGIQWLGVKNISPTVTYYPDPLGEDASAPSGTKGLSDSSTLGVFGHTGRDAVIHSVWLADKLGTEILNIYIKGTSTVVASFTASSLTVQSFSFGPDGLRVPGGFQIEVAGVGSLSAYVSYEVV